MTELKRIMTHLDILRTWAAVNPEFDMGLSINECRKAVKWLDDAMDFLEAQEPRIMTLEEILSRTDQFACWMQWRDGPFFLAVVRPREDIIDYVGINNAFVFFPEQYGKEVVIWTGKPTEEQRKAVKWDA